MDARLAAVFNSEPVALRDPYAIFNALREQVRTYQHGPALLISRYDDVRTCVRDTTRLSNNAGRTGTRTAAVRAALSSEHRAAFDEVSAIESNFITRADGELHQRLRRITHRAFTPRRVEAMRTAIEGYMDELLAPSLSEPVADLAPLAYRLPLIAICDMLGAPASDRERIHGWSAALGRNRQGVELEPLLAAHAAHREFRAYVDAIAEQHRQAPEPAGDLVGALIDAEQGEILTDEELAATFVILLFAGHETTTNLIGIGLLELLRRPDQWQWLVEDPSRAGQAVEELLRFVTPVQWLVRVANEPLELAGTRIEEGQTVIPVLSSANRDPEAFEDPDRLDLQRANARQHVAFGLGPHFCLGASLARLEGEVALRTLARRFPEMQLVDEPLTWGGSTQMRHLLRLPVRLGPDRG